MLLGAGTGVSFLGEAAAPNPTPPGSGIGAMLVTRSSRRSRQRVAWGVGRGGNGGREEEGSMREWCEVSEVKQQPRGSSPGLKVLLSTGLSFLKSTVRHMDRCKSAHGCFLSTSTRFPSGAVVQQTVGQRERGAPLWGVEWPAGVVGTAGSSCPTSSSFLLPAWREGGFSGDLRTRCSLSPICGISQALPQKQNLW